MHMICNITFTVPNEVWRRGCRKLQSCLKHSKHGTTGYNLSNNACLLLLRTVNCVSPWLVSTLSLSFFFLTSSLTMSPLLRVTDSISGMTNPFWRFQRQMMLIFCRFLQTLAVSKVVADRVKPVIALPSFLLDNFKFLLHDYAVVLY